MRDARHGANRTRDMLRSFNSSLAGAEHQTLFQVSLSLYENEYVQRAVRALLDAGAARQLEWRALAGGLGGLGLLLVEVAVIGMRYYPLLGVLDEARRDSLVCLALAAAYMWADLAFNVALTGMCEGLKLNVSFKLLRDLRRVFGVGFVYEMGERTMRPALWNMTARAATTAGGGGAGAAGESSLVDDDLRLLFSENRIVYTVVKSLPHFFCLALVTARLTALVCVEVGKRVRRMRVRVASACSSSWPWYSSGRHSKTQRLG